MINTRDLNGKESKNWWIQQLVLWVSVFIGYSYILSFSAPFPRYLIVNLAYVPLYMAAYYLLRYVQIPRLYQQRKVVLFVLSLFGSAALLFGIFLTAWVMGLGNALGNQGRIPFLDAEQILRIIVRFYSPAMVLLAWESHQESRKEQLRRQKLEKEKMESELKFLKAQINPHFLFNTLNNLYSFVVNDSPKAPDMILQLSGILDYLLYKSQQKTVHLYETLETIQHFIGLEQLRYGDRLQVNFQYGGNTSVPISPLILLSLVENAFKHGASGDIDRPRIHIDIQEAAGAIRCKVWNTKSPYRGELNDAYKEGIGLDNIKRQLRLLYPDAHDLSIQNNEHDFTVSLNIRPVS